MTHWVAVVLRRDHGRLRGALPGAGAPRVGSRHASTRSALTERCDGATTCTAVAAADVAAAAPSFFAAGPVARSSREHAALAPGSLFARTASEQRRLAPGWRGSLGRSRSCRRHGGSDRLRGFKAASLRSTRRSIAGSADTSARHTRDAADDDSRAVARLRQSRLIRGTAPARVAVSPPPHAAGQRPYARDPLRPRARRGRPRSTRPPAGPCGG